MDPRATAAARENAGWCDRVCRAHGVPTVVDGIAWSASRRTPPLYPDAVTLSDRARGSELLSRVDATPGCSIKDSVATLDLSPAGFHVLFEAEWIHRDPAPLGDVDATGWTTVRTPEELRAFGAAHGGGDVFHRALLRDPSVVLLAAWDGSTVTAGAIGHRATTVVGVSNLFSTAAPDDAWSAATSLIGAHFPGLPLVGYAHGDDLGAARRAGFGSVGALRVWLLDA